MKISAVVAYADNYVIGKDNDLPWYLPADLKYFKKVTLNHHLIMGRKVFESIGRPLPKRTNIVLTRNPYYAASGTIIAHGLSEAIGIAQDNGEEEVMIIGGGEIYKQSMAVLDKLYITEVHTDIEGDTYFPVPDFSQWELVHEEHHTKDEKNEYDYTFKTYERR